MSQSLSDSFILIKRSLLHIFRSMDQMMSLILQPIMFMLLFRYVFGGAIDTGDVSYVNFLTAGIIVQTAAFGATYTAWGVAADLQKGIIDRFKSLPMFSSAVLVGHVTADLFRNFVSTIVMLIVAFIVGFRPTATFGEWILIFGLLMLFTFALSWLSAILGMLAKSVETVQWLTFIFIFPLTFASSAYVPTDTMPWILKVFAENQPVTLVVNALRGWMVGTPVGNQAWLAFIWCIGITVVSIPITAYLFRRK